MKKFTLGCLMVVAGSCVAAGCAEKGGEAGATSASAGASAKPATSAMAAAASATAAAAPATAAAVATAAATDDGFAAFKDLDLSSFHKLWKGFTIKAPEGATVKQGSTGPTIT